MSGLLVLVRHGQSEWNLKNLFTGWRDPQLTELGIHEAKTAGQKLSKCEITFDYAFSSCLIRAQETCRIILEEIKQDDLKPVFSQALNERDYGNLSGMNKDEAKKKWGERQVEIWRRSYDIAPPEGESLKDTAARVWLFYMTSILPKILKNQDILVTAHGNSLRSLVMLLDNLNENEIVDLNIKTGVPIVYRLKEDSTVFSKKIL
ncbi:LOW QUALITY PROTEIN: Phosphoglycerate mutase [Liberibacter crescens BT-1]|uniref:2,3-bisphosphoglycerate-dependent phosphoglycerate mutase n=1 Tax=Liberibacter crescens (strain BT-1) TaxID=1215343 RepID=L0EVJ6_LIBCB|nr:2,3-bisphosphoglycerate-dependent phosphoglycerate mutase [Liberibacter crescens]AGA64688.1 LOW QUALITY PROTEIN: Phosphoglycerate mutase [Liberibacter crescens BT-1]AMC12786.1 phosphoglyceromutase [Liberibacter crescens]